MTRATGMRLAWSAREMAFRVRADESVTHGFHRLARKELKAARDEIRGSEPPRTERIHDARTSLKKARAILQLIVEDGGTHLGKSEKRMRRINRTLSGLRDADALIETLETLRTHHPRIIGEETFARLRRQLTAERRAAADDVERDGGWKAVERTLRTLQRDAKHWQPGHRGARALTCGIRAAHRRGRKAMQRATKRQRADDFHAWRKELKTLWYALRLVEESDPTIRRDVRALHRAETLLGDEHNLVVLCEKAFANVTICREPADIDRVRIAADRDQCRLRAKTTASIRYLFERDSGGYARHVTRSLTAWRKRVRHGASG